jgi:hypothetical protein
VEVFRTNDPARRAKQRINLLEKVAHIEMVLQHVDGELAEKQGEQDRLNNQIERFRKFADAKTQRAVRDALKQSAKNEDLLKKAKEGRAKYQESLDEMKAKAKRFKPVLLIRSEVRRTTEDELTRLGFEGLIPPALRPGPNPLASSASPLGASLRPPAGALEGLADSLLPGEPRHELRRVDGINEALFRSANATNGRLIFLNDQVNAIREEIRGAVRKSKLFAELYFTGDEAFSSLVLTGGIRIAERGELRKGARGLYDLEKNQIVLSPESVEAAEAGSANTRQELRATIIHETVHAHDDNGKHREFVQAFEKANPILGLYRAELRAHAVTALLLGPEVFKGLEAMILEHVVERTEEALNEHPELRSDVAKQMGELFDLMNAKQPMYGVVVQGLYATDSVKRLEKLGMLKAAQIVYESSKMELRKHVARFRGQGLEVVVVTDEKVKAIAEGRAEAVNLIVENPNYAYLLGPLIHLAGLLGRENFIRVFGLPESALAINANVIVLVEAKVKEFYLNQMIQLAV